MKLDLEHWEINLVLNALAEIPYKESGAVIQRIKEQVDPSVVHCKDCTWFAPIESNQMAKKIHDICDTGNETGVCRKVTFSPDRPVLTRPEGYCHRADRKE